MQETKTFISLQAEKRIKTGIMKNNVIKTGNYNKFNNSKNKFQNVILSIRNKKENINTLNHKIMFTNHRDKKEG